jgi:hypothetical protein
VTARFIIQEIGKRAGLATAREAAE